jgi:hypothetical protein
MRFGFGFAPGDVENASAAHEKKRPTPEGAGLPGVVSSNIVNWEGNYILDTNTLNIVIRPPKTLTFSHRQKGERVP